MNNALELPEDDRQYIVDHLVEGYTPEEIALLLKNDQDSHVSQDTVEELAASEEIQDEVETQRMIQEKKANVSREELVADLKEAKQALKEQFRELYEREQENKRQLQEEHEAFKHQIKTQTIQSEATKLASELTRDTARSELLQEKVAQYAKYSDNGVDFELGGVPVEKDKILAHLKEKYPFLVDGSGATGGGASGSQNGGAVTSKSFGEMNGSELSQLRAENPTEYERLRNDYYGQR